MIIKIDGKEMIVGNYRDREFRIKECQDGYFKWYWSSFGGHVATIGECYGGIRRSASDWTKDNSGNWIHSQEPI